MTNPFEDTTQQFLVLVNSLGQYSLWPYGMTIPQGWDVKLGPSDREVCLDFVDKNWTNLRPGSSAE